MNNFKDLSGQKFHKLKVINFSHKRKTNYFFNCECDCGKLILISSKSLRRGTKSCGCSSPHMYKGRNNKNWKGYGELSQNLFRIYERNAKKKNLVFEIDIKYAWELFLKQDRKCALTGIPLVFNETFLKQPDRTASLDRIDSSKGYIEGNIQWVHKWINYFKSNVDNLFFIKICAIIAKHNNIDCTLDEIVSYMSTVDYIYSKKKKKKFIKND